jgi:hypothetical protein
MLRWSPCKTTSRASSHLGHENLMGETEQPARSLVARCLLRYWPLSNERKWQASYPLEIPFWLLISGLCREPGVGLQDLIARSNASEYSTMAIRRSSSRRLFSALSSGEYRRSGRSMNERSLPSTVFMRSSALLRVSRPFRVGTISSSLAYKRHSPICSLTTPLAVFCLTDLRSSGNP